MNRTQKSAISFKSDLLLDSSKFKPVWHDQEDRYYKFYCPLCAVQRRIPFSPKPWQLKYILQIALTTVIVSMISWPWFGWKGLVAFVPIWTVFEVIYRIRTRGVLRCRQCGFDPFLYLVDEGRAKGEVENHWKKLCEERNLPYPLTPESIRAHRAAALSKASEAGFARGKSSEAGLPAEERSEAAPEISE